MVILGMVILGMVILGMVTLQIWISNIQNSKPPWDQTAVQNTRFKRVYTITEIASVRPIAEESVIQL